MPRPRFIRALFAEAELEQAQAGAASALHVSRGEPILLWRERTREPFSWSHKTLNNP